MARPLRIEYAGAIYHVTSRGDRREAIYLDEKEDLMGDPLTFRIRGTGPRIGIGVGRKNTSGNSR